MTPKHMFPLDRKASPPNIFRSDTVGSSPTWSRIRSANPSSKATAPGYEPPRVRVDAVALLAAEIPQEPLLGRGGSGPQDLDPVVARIPPGAHEGAGHLESG